jgi:hypothetical protein
MASKHDEVEPDPAQFTEHHGADIPVLDARERRSRNFGGPKFNVAVEQTPSRAVLALGRDI